MSRRLRIAIIVLLVAVVGGVAWQVTRPCEPVYKGKPLSVWLEQYSTNRDELVQLGVGLDKQTTELDKQAEAAIRAIGTNSIPRLLGLMAVKESRFKSFVIAHTSSQWQDRLHIPHARDYRKALSGQRSLGAFGIVALGAELTPAVPALVIMLGDTSAAVRGTAALAGRIGPAAHGAVPALIKCLQDPDRSVQIQTTFSLGQIHQGARLVVPILIGCLHSNHFLF